MRFVQHATVRPHRCAVLPYVGNSSARGYIDTGSELDREHVYISVQAIEEMARMIEWAPPSVVRALEKQAVQAALRARELELRVAELEGIVDAVHTLKAAGMTSARKPGRPRKQEVA